MPKRKNDTAPEDDASTTAKKLRYDDSDSDSDGSSDSADSAGGSDPSLSSSSDANAKIGEGDRSSPAEAKDASAQSPPTVTIALPGSVVANAQGLELKTWLSGQIARALTIFKVDEVVIFSEDGSEIGAGASRPGEEKYRSDPNIFLYRLLRYLETPPYLRRALFPMYQDLRYAGALSPLDAPHHQNTLANSRFREGVVQESWDDSSSGDLAVNVGLHEPIAASFDEKEQPAVGERVTVEIDESSDSSEGLRGRVVSPSRPRDVSGLHWGYTTRLACGIEEVFENCPYEGGYDLSLGTSERGELAQTKEFSLSKFRHLIIFVGGPKGLENCALKRGEALSKPAERFDRYINVCANQGSGTIRTEEALLVIMSVLHPHIEATRS